MPPRPKPRGTETPQAKSAKRSTHEFEHLLKRAAKILDGRQPHTAAISSSRRKRRRSAA